MIFLGPNTQAYSSSPVFSLKEWLEPITFVIHAKKLSTPIGEEYDSKPSIKSKIIRPNTYNLIISLGQRHFSSREELNKQKLSSKKIANQIIRNKIKVSLLNYKKPFISSENYGTKMSYYQFKDWHLNQELRNFRLAILNKEGKNVEKRLKNSLKELKLEWNILYGIDIEELKSILKDPKIRNLIVIAHGNEQGILYDYDLNPFPKSLFTGREQTTQSIAIFSCYSKKAAQWYGLDSHKIHSMYKKRHLFYLPEDNKILSRKGTIYINGIPTFIKKVDSYIAEKASNDLFSEQSLHFAPGTRLPKCSLKISGIFIKSGLFQVILNRNWIGSLKQETVNPNFYEDFDCSILKQSEQNVLLITHAKPSWHPQAIIKKFQIEIYSENTLLLPKETKHFTGEGDIYTKSKIVF